MPSFLKKVKDAALTGGILAGGSILGIFLKTSSENADILKTILETSASTVYADVPGGGSGTGTSSCTCASGGGTSGGCSTE